MKETIKRLLALFLVLCLSAADVCAAAGAVSTLVLPQDLQVIDEEAFYGATSIEKVVVPEGATEIGSKAFAGSSLRELHLPGTLTHIAEDAFADCGPILVSVPENSYAYDRCVELGLIGGPFSLMIENSVDALTLGETVTWTITTTSTAESLVFDYEVLCNGESVYFSTLQTAELVFAPTQPGAYTLRVTATAPDGVTSSGESGEVTAALRDTATPAADFAYKVIDKQYARITAYNGSDAHIVFPESIDGYPVQEIGEHLFHGNQRIVSVVIPDTVTRIWNAVFENCDSLVSVNLGNSVKRIDSFAFQDCDKLGSLAFPDSIETFGMNVAAHCDQLAYVRYPVAIKKSDVRTVAGCPLLTRLVLPEDMTAIPGFMFSGCTNLKEVVFPSGIESIGRDAFAGCSGLTELVLPAKLKVVHPYAFNGCSGVKDIVFPEGLESIDTYSFANCTSLVEADLPDSVTAIGELAFKNCTSLESFHYPLSLTQVLSRHENGHLYGGDTFMGCTSLKTLTIPEGITSIPNQLFAGANGLEEIHFPSTLEAIGRDGFARCTSLKVVELPENLKTLHAYAFNGCTKLTDVIFNDGLDTLETGVFGNCSSLVEADLPDSVRVIGEDCFINCTSLETFDYPMSWEKVYGRYDDGVLRSGQTFSNCPKLTRIVIPEGVTTIPDFAFRVTEYVEEISLPSTLVTVGRDAFAQCTSLTKVELPANVKTLRPYAFADCTNLADVVFPNGLEAVQTGVFVNCSSLVEADLPDTVSVIGEDCFLNCTSLEFFDYPMSWTTVYGRYDDGVIRSGYAFNNCPKLTKLEIPEGVTDIPSYAFRAADYLEEISFPSTLETIGRDAFSRCEALTKVHLPANLKTLKSYAFAECHNLADVDFPYGLEALQTGVFLDCYALVEADLPDTVSIIGEECFVNCTSLEYFDYPMSWEKVYGRYDNGVLYGSNIFHNCPNLTHVDIPEGVAIIPQQGFAGADYLQTASVPFSVHTLQQDAFARSTALTRVYLSPNVTSIARYAFHDCPNLEIHCEYATVALNHAITYGIKYFYLSLTDASLPSGTLYKGVPFSLWGYVRSSEPVSSVTATIYNADGSQVLQTVTVSPYVKDFSLSGVVHASLNFAALDLGTYRYSLVATARDETETLAYTTFTVVPQPLAIFVQQPSAPKGIFGSAYGLSLGGTITSNYPITQVAVTVTDVSTGAVMRKPVVYPGTNDYNLRNINDSLYLSILPDGSYTICVDAVSNGETRCLMTSDFRIFAGAGTISEETIAALEEFAKNSANMQIFTTKYATAVINDMQWIDSFVINLNDFLNFSIPLKDLLKNGVLTTGSEANSVTMYKNEIIAMIESGEYDHLYPTSEEAETVEAIVSYLEDAGTIASSFATSDEVGDMIDTINTLISTLNISTSGVSGVENAYRNMAVILMEVQRGIQILDYLGESMHVQDNKPLRKALTELKKEYSAQASAEMYELCEAILDMEIATMDILVSKLTDLLAEKIFAKTFLAQVSLAKVTAKLAMDFTGLSSVAEAYHTFFVRYDILLASLDTYYNAFSRVYGGDHSAEALTDLSMAIFVTRSAWTRHREAMRNIEAVAFTIAQEAHLYENETFRGLEQLIPDAYR